LFLFWNFFPDCLKKGKLAQRTQGAQIGRTGELAAATRLTSLPGVRQPHLRTPEASMNGPRRYLLFRKGNASLEDFLEIKGVGGQTLLDPGAAQAVQFPQFSLEAGTPNLSIVRCLPKLMGKIILKLTKSTL
jgi:hypothetical protein